MITTSYIRLTKAAETLETDEDTLLIAASERKIRLYWLLNKIVEAELGFYEEAANPEPDEPPSWWVPQDFALKHFMYIPLSFDEAAELLRSDVISARANQLSDQFGPNMSFWVPFNKHSRLGGGLNEEDLRVNKGVLFIKTVDLENMKKQQSTPPIEAVGNNPKHMGKDHISEKLSLLNQAAVKFWANADPNDRETHPTNIKVAAWLHERGLHESTADNAASLIRPQWAPKGRKPDI